MRKGKDEIKISKEIRVLNKNEAKGKTCLISFMSTRF
jgi:hypothetical protein